MFVFTCSEGSAYMFVFHAQKVLCIYIKKLYHLSFSALVRAFAIFEFCRSEVVISVRGSQY